MFASYLRSASAGLFGTSLVCLLLASTTTIALYSQQQIPGAFRSRVVVVPVDVHVADSRGRPITDLTQADFTILEDGKPQEIAHFAFQQLTAEPAAVDPGGPAFRQRQGTTLEPQRQRVFLLFLGRGRLQHPAMGVDGLLEFVSQRLLPQDQIAVMAWNRATSFTTDHARILSLLERFKTGHEEIEAWFAEQGRTLAAIYGTSDLPESIQRKIDAIFEGMGGRSIMPDPLADTDAVVAEHRQAIGDLMRNDAASQRTNPALSETWDEPLRSTGGALALDEYLQATGQSVHDLGNLYKAVSYLRYLEGEKHLIFVSAFGLFLPSVAGNSGIAAAAADARVAIDTFHTAGLPAYDSRQLVTPTVNSGSTLRSVADEARMAAWATANSPHFRVQTLRAISEYTGGVSWAYRRASDGLERVDQATRSSYLIGYHPRTDDWNGRYRRIEVKVNRDGARVLARGGYYARDQIVTTSRREFLTYTRIAAAGGYRGDAEDIGLELAVTGDARAKTVTVRMQVDPSRLSFENANGRHAVTLDVAIFCGDEDQEIVGELWRKVDLNFTDDTFARLKRERLEFEVTVSVSEIPRFVKAVVYDYGADLVGSSTAVLR